MPKLSDMPGTYPHLTNSSIFVPFTCYLRIDPIRGKRQETYQHALILAALAETDLTNLCTSSGGSAGLDFDYSKPLSYIPQFGNIPARLSFTGNVCRRSTYTKTPEGVQTIDNDNTVKTGMGAGNNATNVSDPIVTQLAHDFKYSIEAATGLSVVRLEISGQVFGMGGTTLP